MTNGEMVLDVTLEDSSSSESAWVRCDDCFKWRRIPASVVGSIDESSRWYVLFYIEFVLVYDNFQMIVVLHILFL